MNGALAIGTLVSCILEIVDAEWNQTATEREAKETHATADKPCAQARFMLDFCHCLEHFILNMLNKKSII